MRKRTSRTAWGLSAIVAVVLLGGIGGALANGIWLGSYHFQLYPTRRWAVGREPRWCDLGTCSQSFHLGFITWHVISPDPYPVPPAR